MIGIKFALFYITDYVNNKDVMAGHGEMTKQEHISKKIWKKPELRVLCRGESEENVLAGCKQAIFGDLGPQGSGSCNYIWACQDSSWS